MQTASAAPTADHGITTKAQVAALISDAITTALGALDLSGTFPSFTAVLASPPASPEVNDSWAPSDTPFLVRFSEVNDEWETFPVAIDKTDGTIRAGMFFTPTDGEGSSPAIQLVINDAEGAPLGELWFDTDGLHLGDESAPVAITADDVASAVAAAMAEVTITPGQIVSDGEGGTITDALLPSGIARDTEVASGDSTTLAAAEAYTDAAVGAITIPEGGSGGAYGPNAVAASNAPAAVKAAVASAGGSVCDGTADNVEIAAKLAAYKHVRLTEGLFNVAATLNLTRGQSLVGCGVEVTVLKAATGLSGRMIYGQNTDHNTLSDFTIDGNSIGTTVTGIELNATSNTGFPSHQKNEACHVLQRLQIHDVTGIGVYIAGTYNRDCKLDSVDVHNAGTDGFKIASPDGKMSKCVAGSPGAYAFNFDGAANWHADNCKGWYAVLDGFIIGATTGSARITLTACEAQDCHRAGFRMARGNAITFTGCIADSNSNTSGQTYSGFEIGLTDPTTASSYVGGGTTLTGCVAYDKNEGSRGYQQKYGFRFGAGTRRLTFTGFGTGDNANHHNVTDGVLFNTSADRTNAENVVLGNNHGVLLKSF
jgi:hypothetical protein